MLLTSVACHSFKLRSISVEDFTDREKSCRELILLPRRMRMLLTSVACHSFKLRSISVEDFTDREKSYRELLLLRSCRKRLNCGRGATRWCQCQVRRCQVPGVWAIEVKDIGRYIMGTHTSGIWLPYVALYLILYYYYYY
jgi:hypothetical protein